MVQLSTREWFQQMWAEVIGTALLTATVKMSVALCPDYAAFAIGLSLMNSVWCFGHISGAMLNPSVTLAIRIREPLKWPGMNPLVLASYFTAQIIGGIFGGILAWAVGGKKAAEVFPHANHDMANYKVRAFFAEVMFTYVLCSVIIRVAMDKRVEGNQYYGLAIGGALAMSVLVAGPISGCCLNLAVYIGCISSALAADSNALKGYAGEWWIYLCAPLIGGLFAGMAFWTLFRDSSSERNMLQGYSQSPENEEPITDADNTAGDIGLTYSAGASAGSGGLTTTVSTADVVGVTATTVDDVDEL